MKINPLFKVEKIIENIIFPNSLNYPSELNKHRHGLEPHKAQIHEYTIKGEKILARNKKQARKIFNSLTK